MRPFFLIISELQNKHFFPCLFFRQKTDKERKKEAPGTHSPGPLQRIVKLDKRREHNAKITILFENGPFRP